MFLAYLARYPQITLSITELPIFIASITRVGDKTFSGAHSAGTVHGAHEAGILFEFQVKEKRKLLVPKYVLEAISDPSGTLNP